MTLFHRIVCTGSVFLSMVTSDLLATDQSQKDDTFDWPRHRGNAALQGVSNLSSEQNLHWIGFLKRESTLKSSVVISEGIAYIGSDLGVLHAIDIESGKEKWNFKTEMAIEAPPLIYQGKVYAGSTDSFLYALSADSGKLLWKYETLGEIMGAANQATRPVSKDEVIIVGSYDNFVHCMDAKSGKGLWKFEPKTMSMGCPQFSIKSMSSSVGVILCSMLSTWKRARKFDPWKSKLRLPRRSL